MTTQAGERITVSINVVETASGFWVTVNNGGDELHPTGPFKTRALAQAATDDFSAVVMKIPNAAMQGQGMQ